MSLGQICSKIFERKKEQITFVFALTVIYLIIAQYNIIHNTTYKQYR